MSPTRTAGPCLSSQPLWSSWVLPMQARHPCVSGAFQRVSPASRRGSSGFHTLPRSCWLLARGVQGCREGLRLYPGLSQTLGSGREWGKKLESCGTDPGRRGEGVPASLYVGASPPPCGGQCEAETVRAGPALRAHQLAEQRHMCTALPWS